MLRRLPIFFACCLFALAAPLAVTAADESMEAAFLDTMAAAGSPVGSPASGADLAVGHGTSCPNPAICGNPREFQLAAASALSSGAAAGIYSQTLTICVSATTCEHGTFRAHVECVRADGNTATIGGVVFQSTFTLPGIVGHEGDPVVVTVYDNGRAGDPLPDQLSFISDEPILEAEGQCLNLAKPPMFLVADGDIRVRDGQVSALGG